MIGGTNYSLSNCKSNGLIRRRDFKAESLAGNNKDAIGNIFGEARTQTTRKETGLLAHMLLAHRLYCFPKISFQNKPPIS
ncbi:hypothetical protein EUGRSUZ_B03383 [Eucalyptus grandis]|uniref:Uncharacterized protein n=2 Tax=Eucalyptus grandis TaxID=71139 RepID=A0ACC3LVZ9_EUCGR|nr:hypothetical protein EUGRSUZ_B03383 [Eucalyptus grandis]